MSFLDELEKSTGKSARTENGAVAYKSTLDPVLDFFSRAGALRGKESEAIRLFKNAYASDPTYALRTLFYLRDIRGGQGERTLFREILDTLDDETVAKVVKFIPEYGRWDEVPLTPSGIELIKAQLLDDVKQLEANKPVSLLGKWLPSENTSSVETRKKAKKLIAALGLKPSKYRKTVSALRKKIKLLEQTMSQREWASIQYDKLPSQAHRKHVKAFKRHDEAGYSEYLGAVEKGEKKINSSTLYTYEIYDMVNGYRVAEDQVRTADAMWKALPDFAKGKNALVMADVSGSMTGRPMSISTSLAVYFAERNDGPFAGKYMTFTDIPEIVAVSGGNIRDKLNYVERHHVGYNTDLQRAFRAILNAAQKANASQEELPEILYIISDMQFDDQMSNCGETNFETAQREFSEAGFQLPHVVFWNVNARDNSPATKFDNRVTLISGSSQSTFSYALAGKTPLESMMDILNSDRYAQIAV